jgi:ATP-dependent helicase/DNAse subunit B
MQKACPEIIYSYALGSYEGKAQRMPYELENHLKNVSKEAWRIVEKPLQSTSSLDHIDPKLSLALHFKPHLKGSISSFERYFECPYHYYLKSGLKLWPEESFEINSAIMGNVMHLLFEEAVQKASKSYPLYLEAHLDEKVSKLMEALKALFRAEADMLDVLGSKLKESLKLSLEFLKDWEANKDYQPLYAEHAFSKTMNLEDGSLLELRGVIDRIDTTLNEALVIDYKSSPKTFSEVRFMQGVQLQLMTYVWALPDELKANAALYFSHKALKYEILTGESGVANRLKNRRVKGILFKGDQSMDNDGSHITSLSLKEDNTVSVSPQYDQDKMIQHLIHLYSSLASGLRDGIITKQNKNNSCLHCDYAHFCQFKGFPIKMKRIKKDDSVLRHEH